MICCDDYLYAIKRYVGVIPTDDIDLYFSSLNLLLKLVEENSFMKYLL